MKKTSARETLTLSTNLLFNILLLMFLSSTNAQSRIRDIIEGIRLNGGNGPMEGNVEIKAYRRWGYVCDDDFGFQEADLVCREFGYDGAERFTRNNHFGNSSLEMRRNFNDVKFWLSREVYNCSNITSTFTDCLSSEVDFHDCGPTEIAGVVCRTNQSVCELEEFPCVESSLCIPRNQVCDGIPQCPDSSDEGECEDVAVAKVIPINWLRMPGFIAGTVLIKHRQQWGSICDDRFMRNDTQVMCRSLGYEGGWAVPFPSAYLGRGPGIIWLDTPYCEGHEQWLGECSYAVFGRHDCTSDEDVGVFCSDGPVGVRLVEGQTESADKQLELKLGEEWAEVCGFGFDDFDAQVVCRSLGYEHDAVSTRGLIKSNGTIWPIQLDCLGNEQTLEECRVRMLDFPCPLDYTASVKCFNRTGMEYRRLSEILPADCGVPEDDAKVIFSNFGKIQRGSAISRFSTPWLVSLRFKRRGRPLLCGGVIISEDYVLTAAHCVVGYSKDLFVVRVGDYDMKLVENSEEEFLIEAIRIHEHYQETSIFENDIAIVKILKKKGRGIRFSSRVKPVCFPNFLDSYQDLNSCKVTGWGRTHYKGRPVRRPREAKVSIVREEVCESGTLGGPRNISSSSVCGWGEADSPAGPCNGDSGGPLTCLVDGRHTLYGLVSFGPPCMLVGSMDKYTRVTKYVPWILRNILIGNIIFAGELLF